VYYSGSCGGEAFVEAFLLRSVVSVSLASARFEQQALRVDEAVWHHPERMYMPVAGRTRQCVIIWYLV